MAKVVIHPAAQREYSAAVRWYQDRSRTAASRFVVEVERIIDVIAAHPDRYGWYEEPFREAGVSRYPYSIVYRVEESGDVTVFAIAHASREPGYWDDRI
jgi:plasmid stabilization system protein ParE